MDDRLRRLVDAANAGLWALDAHGRTTYANAWIADRLGVSVDDMLGRPLESFVEPSVAPIVPDLLQRRRAGLRETHAFVLRRADGAPFAAIVSATPLFDDTGTFEGAVAVLSDVAEVRRADAPLRWSEDRLAQVMAVTPLGVFVCDASGHLVSDVNATACSMLGGLREDFVQKAVSDAGLETDPERWAAAVREARAGAAVRSLELSFRRRDGAQVPVLCSFARFRTGSTAPQLLVFAQDLRAQKRIEAELRASEARFSELFHHSPVGLAVVRARDGALVDVNDAWSRLTGHAREQIVGRALSSVLTGDDADGAAAFDREVREHAQAASREIAFRTRGGDRVWALVSSTRLARQADTLSLVSAQDVSERRALEEKMRLADRVGTMGTMAAGIGHEINNPLAYVLLNLDFAARELARTAPSRPVLQAIEDARQGAERVRDIVRDLRMLSREPDAQGSSADVAAVVRAAANMTSHEIRHRATLELDLADTPRVAISESRLVQIVVNLLLNAAQAIPEGAASAHRVRVSSATCDRGVEIEIADTGVGIPPELLAKIFDPFFTTKPVGAGTGLGLAIVHGILRAIGGEIGVRSTVGRGTTFRITIPCAEPHDLVRARVAAVAPVRRRVLAIDDEAMVLAALRRALPEHDLTTETHAASALERIRGGERFDVILCDVTMPDVTGIDFRAALIEVAPRQVPALVFMTGGAFTDRAREHLAVTDVPVLEKPLDIERVRAEIEHAAARTR